MLDGLGEVETFIKDILIYKVRKATIIKKIYFVFWRGFDLIYEKEYKKKWIRRENEIFGLEQLNIKKNKKKIGGDFCGTNFSRILSSIF